MWSQVCLRRQVNHHVYPKPVLGTDQTFALPASPLCRSFLSVLPSTLMQRPAGEAARRQTASRQSRNAKKERQRFKDSIEVSLSLSLCVWLSYFMSSSPNHRFLKSDRLYCTYHVCFWNSDSISHFICVQLNAHDCIFPSLISTVTWGVIKNHHLPVILCFVCNNTVHLIVVY